MECLLTRPGFLYPEQNTQDVLSYIQHYLTSTELGTHLNSWLSLHHINSQEFSQRLIAQSENNFMYLSQILTAASQQFYQEPSHIEQLPPGLEAYYQSHWQKMQDKGLSRMQLAILQILGEQNQPLSAEMMAEMIDEDEYEVEAVLENWFEFLQQQHIEGETRYSFYHPSFRDYLCRVCIA